MADPFLAVATLCGGLFAGATAYVSLVAQPVRMRQEGVELRIFRDSLRRSERINPALHVITLVATIAAVFVAASPLRIVALIALLPILPLSLLVIMPVNTTLKDPQVTPGSHIARRFLARWGRLHAVRAACGVLAFVALAAA